MAAANQSAGAMRPRRRPRSDEQLARWYFAALAQSSLGTGAAAVALLLVAYERFRSPWAIGLVLLADVAPAMLLGPVFGAAADRWSRRLAHGRGGRDPGRCFRRHVPRRRLHADVSLRAAGRDRDGPVHARGPGVAAERGGARAAPCRDIALWRRRWTSATSSGPAWRPLFLLVAGPEVVLAANAVRFARLGAGADAAAVRRRAGGGAGGRGAAVAPSRGARGSGRDGRNGGGVPRDARRLGHGAASSARCSTSASCCSRRTSSTPATSASRCS